MRYRISREAVEDIAGLYLEGYRQFGERQAETYHAGLKEMFAILADFPRLSRERSEFTPPLRIHAYHSHIVVYVIEGDEIVILRVRHGREDWESAN